MTPHPRVAVVTGAATGIGAGVTRALLAAGWEVVATRLPGQAPEGGMERARFVEVDLTDGETPRRLAAETLRAGHLRLVVSAAGVSLPGPVELRADDLAAEFAINAAAPARLIAALLPQLRLTRGRIVLIGAGQSRVALPFGAGYAASKAALVAVADALRMELHDDGIFVTVVELGAVRTGILAAGRMRASALMDRSPAEQRKRYEARMMSTLARAGRAFERAMPVERAATSILRIAHARAPRPTVLLGRDARALAIVAYLPQRVRSRVVRQLSAPTRRAG